MLDSIGKQYSFRFLWFGQMFANLGDILYVVCLMKIISDTTGSVTYMSLVPFLNTFSGLISGLLAPLVIRKYRLKSILFYSQTGKTFLMFLLSIFSGMIQAQSLSWIFLLVCWISFLDGWAAPARNALVPSLVEESCLVKTNSLLSISDQIVQLMAWPTGSILLVMAGASNMLWITLCLYAISSAFMGLILQNGKHSESEQDGLSRMGALKQGWSIIWSSKQLRTISIMNILETLANAVWIAAILFVYVSEALNKGENWWGFINGTFFAGMLIAGLWIYRFSSIVERNLGKTILFSTLSLSFITILFGNTSIPWFALFLSFLFGIPQMARDVAETTIIQRNARAQVLAKVYSARGTMIYACFGISSLVMGWITEEFGVRTTFRLAAILFVCSFMVAARNRNHLYNSSHEQSLGNQALK